MASKPFLGEFVQFFVVPYVKSAEKNVQYLN